MHSPSAVEDLLCDDAVIGARSLRWAPVLEIGWNSRDMQDIRTLLMCSCLSRPFRNWMSRYGI
jgi:hypothetical protein